MRAGATHHGCGWLRNEEDKLQGRRGAAGQQAAAAAAALGFGKNGERMWPRRGYIR